MDLEDNVWGVVPVSGRGSLPFSLVHGESLVAAAAFALEAAEIELLDPNTPMEIVRDSGRPLVLHDPLCPLTSPAFLAEAVARCRESGAVVVGVLPVTDTVKRLEGDRIGATVDRDGLLEVASPIVLPAAAVAAMTAVPATAFVELVDQLRSRWPVEFVIAPPQARRVRTQADLPVLEALTA